MTGTLITVLFLMNIMFAFVVLLLFMRQNRLMEIEKRQKHMLEESEQVMYALLEEIKEENERLLRNMTEKQEEALTKREYTPEALIEEIYPNQKSTEPLMEQLELDEIPVKKEPVDLEDPEPPRELLPIKEQVNLLASQGLSVTQIAKKLNKGKTEIELLIKFQ